MVKVVLLIMGMHFLAGCAGPTTPFGGLSGWLPSQLEKAKNNLEQRFLASLDNEDLPAEITVNPSRQVLHDRSDVKISVYDPKGIPAEYSVKAYFDGYDVSDLIFAGKNDDVHPGDRLLSIQFKNLRIPAGMEKDILFVYKRTPESKKITYKWESPNCSTDKKMKVQHTDKFSPPTSWIKNINKAADSVDINPSLLAGLVAQESSFNPHAVSWAKAIGLTQITPIADKQLKSVEWKRSNKINRYPSTYIKTLILTGKLTAEDDYRLNPNTSVQAGALYLDYLRAYWDRKSHRELLAKNFDDVDEALTKVLLASYNSGAARVKRAIKEYGSDFLKSNELKEARKYVSRTSSFCYHFSNREEEG